jgi:chorismate dehydratase
VEGLYGLEGKKGAIAMAERPWRVGAVSYLNTKPLIEGLAETLIGRGTLELDLPSRLADRLKVAQLDVALIPSVEFFAKPDWFILSDACIGCRGPVWSVRALFRKPPHQVRSLALDVGSRTSAAMLRVLLAETYGIQPELEPFAIDAPVESTSADCVLVIGDRAMRQQWDGVVEHWDLGEQWVRRTGLPFVFAMWIANPSSRAGYDDAAWKWLERALEEARDRGCGKMAELAMRHCKQYALTREQCLAYFEKNLYFQLDGSMLEGLRCYEQMVRRWCPELIPAESLAGMESSGS